MSVLGLRTRSALSIMLTCLMVLGAVPLAFAAGPVAVPDGSPDVVTSIYGAEESGGLGYDVAYDGDLVAIGIPGAASGGEVAIYRRTSAGLSHETTITGPDAGNFGLAVDVSDDILIVGAPGANSNDGMAYFYRESGGTWSLETTISGSAGDADRFGTAVAVDGAYAAIGAPSYAASDGYVYIATDSGSGWVFETGRPGIRGSRAQLGSSVDVSVDGAYPVIVAGGYRYSSSRGYASILRYVSGSWVAATVTGPNSGSWFGRAVGTDGTSVVVGAPLADVREADAGAVYVYGPTGGSVRTVLQPASVAIRGNFGATIDIDNGTLAVGSPALDRATLFTGSLASWTEGATYGPPSALPSDTFPSSLAVQGNILFAGSAGDDTLAASGGAVHEYSTGWYSATEETTLTVPAPGVLGNDFDTDGDSLESYLVTDTPNGTVTMNTDGGFQYVPDVDFNGYDTFTYRTFDGSTYSSPTVATIFVAGVNDAPEFVQSSPTTVTCSEDEDPTPFALTLDVDDPDTGDTITWGIMTAPANGTASVSGTGLSKSIDYTPDPNFHGTDSFEVRVNDSARTYDYLWVDVVVDPINDAPNFTLRSPYNTVEDAGPITVPNWATSISPGTYQQPLNRPPWSQTANVANEATQTLSINTINNNPSLFTVQPNVSVTGTLTFESVPNAYGSATVSVGLTDDDTAGAPGSITTTKTMTINVAPVNDAPIAGSDAYMTDEDEALVVPAAGILENDTDTEGPADIPYFGPLTSHLETTTAHGALFLFDNGSFIYSPDEGWSGTDTFTYRAFDGGLYSEPMTVTIDVTSVNDEPIIDQGGTIAIGCAEDGSVDTTLTAIDYDGDTLAWTVVAEPADGEASVVSSDTTGVVTYSPDPDYHGHDSFIVQASDGMGGTDLIVIEVDVTPVNDAPVAAPLAYETAEDTTLTVLPPGLYDGFSDVDGDLPADSRVTPGAQTYGTLTDFGGGSFVYLPDTDFNGEATFVYEVFDGAAWSVAGTVTVTVTPVNDAPSFAPGAPVSVPEDSGDSTTDAWATALDAGAANEMQTLSFELTNDNETLFSAQPALSSTGTLTFTPAHNANGTATVSATLFDDDSAGGPALASNVVTFTIEVTPVNDAPVAGDNTFEVAEDTTLTVAPPGILDDDQDVDRDPLSATLETSPTCGTLTLETDGSFTYVPHPDYSGPDAFTYRASDAQTSSAPATVTITVTPVNDAPVALGESYVLEEDVTLEVDAATGLLGNDSDIDGDALTSVLVTDTARGALSLNDDGSFSYTPGPGWSGTDTFAYSAYDGDLMSDAVEVTLTVESVDTDHRRVEGPNRFVTAVAASKLAFPGSADTVIIATAYNWPDALAGSGLAGAVDGPVLLTRQDRLPGETLGEIRRLGATQAYVLGGRAAASDAVVNALEAELGASNVTRIGGIDRYETAALVSAEVIVQLGPSWDGTALLATGRDFPDAIAASPLSAAAGWPVFLIHPDGVTSADTTMLAGLNTGHAVVLGGDASIPTGAESTLASGGISSERVSGSDRYSTSIAIAEYGAAQAGLSWDVVGFATGLDFPDALAGGVACSSRNGVMILNPRDTVNDSLRRALTTHRSEIDEVLYFGGEAAISQDVRDTVRNILR